MSEDQRSLGSHAVHSSIWQISGQIAQAIPQLAILAVLSRHVTPREFGTYGLGMVLVGLVHLLAEFGVGPALVQTKSVTNSHIRVGLTVSLLNTAFLATLTWVFADNLGEFFGDPALPLVARALSLTMVLGGAAVVANGLLVRSMNFRWLALADTSSYLIGFGALAIPFALLDAGVWALVVGITVQTGVRGVLQYYAVRHDVRPSLKRDEAIEMFRYGSGLTLWRLLNYIAVRADYIIVGRYLGSHALGLYERAYRLMEIPATYVAGAIGTVGFPAMTRIQSDTPRLRNAYFRGTWIVGMVYLPLSAVLVLIAPALIEGLFGTEWTGAVRPLQILSIGLLFRAGYKVSDALLMARGVVYEVAWRVALYAVAVIVGTLAALRWGWGIQGVASAIVMALLIRFVLVNHLSLSAVESGWFEFLKTQVPGLIITVIVVAAVGPIVAIVGGSSLSELLKLLIYFVAAVTSGLLGFLALPPTLLGSNKIWLQQVVRDEMRRHVH